MGFDKWKGEGNCGQSYNPADNPTDRTRPGNEPAEWCGSNVSQLGMASTSTLCVQRLDGNNKYAELKNQSVGIDLGLTSIKSNAPGFLSLVKPWVFATSGMTNKDKMALGDGGVYGSVNFSNKPDAIRLKYRRAAVNSEKLTLSPTYGMEHSNQKYPRLLRIRALPLNRNTLSLNMWSWRTLIVQYLVKRMKVL